LTEPRKPGYGADLKKIFHNSPRREANEAFRANWDEAFADNAGNKPLDTAKQQGEHKAKA
jgi:hypothetical protein